ncbi:hypothetical protein D9M69_604520 [compost metagenome]
MAHHGRAAAVLHVVADGVAAARIADEHDLGRARGFQHLLDLGAQERGRVGGGTAPRLGHGVVVAGQGIRLVERKQPLARPAVRFEAPDRGLPQRRRVAVAVHEDDGRTLGGRGRGGGAAGQPGDGGASGKGKGKQGAAGRHVCLSPGRGLGPRK